MHVGDQEGHRRASRCSPGRRPASKDAAVQGRQFDDFTSGPPMLQAMPESGSVDVGGVGDAPPVFAAAGGEKIAVVGATFPNVASAATLVPKGSSITSISQLRGKRIAVAQGSSADYELLAQLTKAGLTPKDVNLIYLQPADALAAFTSHHVDAWAVWSPYIEQAETQYGAKAIATGKGYGGNDRSPSRPARPSPIRRRRRRSRPTWRPMTRRGSGPTPTRRRGARPGRPAPDSRSG